MKELKKDIAMLKEKYPEFNFFAFEKIMKKEKALNLLDMYIDEQNGDFNFK